MISRMVLRDILIEQRERVEKSVLNEFVAREYLANIKNFAALKQSIVITGVRRCGKSVFLSQIANTLFSGDFYYVNFEDERLATFDVMDFNMLYEICVELFGEKHAFFLDEIQNISGWERWVRRMYDEGFKFFITGSNARMLSKELGTLLTGRHLQFSLFPFSFKEFLKFKKVELEKKDLHITERRAIIKKCFSEYVTNGGFPEHIKNAKIEILQEYFHDIIQRDIVDRYSIKNIKQLHDLARYLLTNTSTLTTYNQLRKLTSIKSTNTIINYFFYLENAYLIIKVPYFSYSLRKQAMNPFKVYSIDTGLRNAICFAFSSDIGRIYENVVAVELKRRNKEIYYWKNTRGEEVDFIINERKVIQLIQVCFDISKPDTKKRELKALASAAKELKCHDLLVITEEYEAEEKLEGKTVRFVPLWKWLITNKLP